MIRWKKDQDQIGQADNNVHHTILSCNVKENEHMAIRLYIETTMLENQSFKNSSYFTITG